MFSRERVSCFRDSISETMRAQISNVIGEAFILRRDEDISRVKELLQGHQEGLFQTPLDGRQQILQLIQNMDRTISTTLKERATEENQSAEMLQSTLNDIHLLVQRMAGNVTNRNTQDIGEVLSHEGEILPQVFEQSVSRRPAASLDNKTIQGQEGDFELALHDLKRNVLKWYISLFSSPS